MIDSQNNIHAVEKPFDEENETNLESNQEDRNEVAPCQQTIVSTRNPVNDLAEVHALADIKN